jgi:transposase
MMQGMKPYSEDLRRSIVRTVEDGTSKSAAARLFGVSLSSVKRYLRIAQRGVSLAPRRREAEGHRKSTRTPTNSLKRTSRSVQPLLWHKGVAS